MPATLASMGPASATVSLELCSPWRESEATPPSSPKPVGGSRTNTSWACTDVGGGALRVVDKLPDNVMLVGLIARLLPRADRVLQPRTARYCPVLLFSAVH